MITKHVRQKYEKPAMQVFELQRQARILAGSPEANMNVIYDEEIWVLP